MQYGVQARLDLRVATQGITRDFEHSASSSNDPDSRHAVNQELVH